MAGVDDDIEGAWQRAIAVLRDVLGSPVNLERVRAYCRAHGARDLAALSDEMLMLVVHFARTNDPGFPASERYESEQWLRTEGARIVAADSSVFSGVAKGFTSLVAGRQWFVN